MGIMKRFYMPIILSVWTLFIQLVAGCAEGDKPSLDAESYFNRGRTYYKKGQYDQAITKYTKAIEINPEFARAYSNRARAYYIRGEHEKAWDDVYRVQHLGYQIQPEFLKALREASGSLEST